MAWLCASVPLCLCGKEMIKIRPLTQADVEQVLAITAASPEAAAWSRQAYQAFLDAPGRGFCRVAEQGGTVVGLVCVRVIGEESELLNIAVHPSARGQGVGSQLMEQALREAAQTGANRMFLEVRETNAPALRLYERLSFAVSGRRPGYYADPPADALVLQRGLVKETSGDRAPSQFA